MWFQVCRSAHTCDIFFMFFILFVMFEFMLLILFILIIFFCWFILLKFFIIMFFIFLFPLYWNSFFFLGVSPFFLCCYSYFWNNIDNRCILLEAHLGTIVTMCCDLIPCWWSHALVMGEPDCPLLAKVLQSVHLLFIISNVRFPAFRQQ